MSGQKACPLPPSCDDIGNKCSGGKTLKIAPADDKYQCLKQCQDNKEKPCKWFSYDNQNKFCYQFEVCNVTIPIQQFVSGEVTCPVINCKQRGHCVVRYIYIPYLRHYNP